MRRMLLILASIALIIATIVFLIMQGGEFFHAYRASSNDMVSFISALLQILGIFFAIILGIFLLFQYLHYIRPHRFIFEGFKNEEELANADAEKRPVNLSKLALEELIKQSVPNISFYLPPSTEETLEYKERVKKFQNALDSLIKTLGDMETPDLAKSIGTITQKEVAPIINFIETILPPWRLETLFLDVPS